MDTIVIRPSSYQKLLLISGLIMFPLCVFGSIWLFFENTTNIALSIILLLMAIAGVASCVYDWRKRKRCYITIDKEKITFNQCAYTVENDMRLSFVGTKTMRWDEIECLDGRAFKTISGEVYTDINVYVYEKYDAKPINSIFGKKGWDEIASYYNKYKTNK